MGGAGGGSAVYGAGGGSVERDGSGAGVHSRGLIRCGFSPDFVIEEGFLLSFFFLQFLLELSISLDSFCRSKIVAHYTHVFFLIKHTSFHRHN